MEKVHFNKQTLYRSEKDSVEYYLYYGSLKDSVSIINIKQNERFISCKKLNIAKRIN